MTVAKFNKLLDEAQAKMAAKEEEVMSKNEVSKEEKVTKSEKDQQEGEDKASKPIDTVEPDTKTSKDDPDKIFRCPNCNFISTDHAAIYKHVIDKYKTPGLVCDLEK